ncbi:MAG: 50S ribosomal protein L31e [Candidatus Aenigmatarchaeota archaeon]
MVEEKILTINIRKGLVKTPNWKRAKEAMKIIKKELEEKVKGEVKIDKRLSELIWSSGIKKPRTKVRVKITKVEKGFLAEPI